MDHRKVRKFWNNNAGTWTRLSRAGYDVYRDHLNTPAFLKILPDVNGLSGLDVGCGEGHNTRLVAQLGARMTALDISDIFVHLADQVEQHSTGRIDYLNASAVELPFKTCSFDFVTSFMSLMDISEIEHVVEEIFRVLAAGGFLQFSISHPCFNTPHHRNLRNKEGVSYAFEVGDYFHNLNGELEEWLFSAAPLEEKKGLRPFQVPRFTHTLSQWMNLLVDTGFTLEFLSEPCPSDQVVLEHPDLQDSQVVAYFLHVRARKPLSAI